MKKGGRSTVKELLLELAEAVQHAVAELVEDPAEVVGRGADGAPSARIDRVAEAAVLRVLDYADARVNVLSEEAGVIDRGGGRTLIQIGRASWRGRGENSGGGGSFKK